MKAASLVRRETARRSIRFWLTYYCGYVIDEEYDGPLIDEIEKGGWSEIVDLAARGSGKTYFWSGVTAYWIAMDRTETGIVTAVNLQRGTRVTLMTRRILERQRVIEDFGTFDTDYWAVERFTVSHRDDEGMAIMAPSVETMGIDAFRPGPHVGWILFEDVEDQERVASPDVIEQTREIDDLAYPMVDQIGGRRITSGTFYSADDLYHHKLEKLGLYRYEDGLPYIPDGITRVGKTILAYRPAGDTYDEGWCPRARYTREQFEDRKNRMSPYQYALQVRLDILGNEDAPFKKHDFVYTDPNTGGTIPARSECFIAYDAARSKKKGSDYTGRSEVFIDPEGVWHVTKARRKRMDAAEFIEMWERDLQAFPRAEYVIEEDAYIAGLRGQIEAMFRRIRIYPRCTWVPAPSRPRKDPRILALQGLFRSKSIIFTRGETEQVEEELLPFPGPGRRDVCDSLANILEIARTPAGKRRHRDDGEGLTRETRWMRKLMQTDEDRPSHRNPRGANLPAREN